MLHDGRHRLATKSLPVHCFRFFVVCVLATFFFLLPFSVCLRFPCNRSTERIKLKSKGATQKNHLIKYEEKKKTNEMKHRTVRAVISTNILYHIHNNNIMKL